MPASVRRTPKNSERDDPTYFDATIGWDKMVSAVVMCFCTNPDGQRQAEYTVYVQPSSFEELAKFMVKASPEAAIKAFGVALQNVKI